LDEIDCLAPPQAESDELENMELPSLTLDSQTLPEADVDLQMFDAEILAPTLPRTDSQTLLGDEPPATLELFDTFEDGVSVDAADAGGILQVDINEDDLIDPQA